MTREKLLGPQVSHLLSNLSDHGTQHLTEIENDLVQTSFLLSEAIEKLGTSFLAIHAAINAQQELIDTLLPNGGETTRPELTEQLKNSREAIDQQVNAVVTALQFQDMTGQLIERTRRRVIGLRDVLASVGTGSTGMTVGSSVGAITKALNGITKVLEEESTKLESTLLKSVCQTHMESGDIELF